MENTKAIQDILRNDSRATSTTHGYIPFTQTADPSMLCSTFIPGMIYLPNFVSEEEASSIQHFLDAEQADIWRTPSDAETGRRSKSRRVQQFGYGFHFRNRNQQVLKALTGPNASLPSCTSPILERLKAQRYLPDDKTTEFDQCIVNDYRPFHGIKPHVDRDVFDEFIVGVSLGGEAVMDFRSIKTREVCAVLLQPRSVVILSGPARHEWQHAIFAASTHVFRGRLIHRVRRTSLTFRKLRPETLAQVKAESERPSQMIKLLLWISLIALMLALLVCYRSTLPTLVKRTQARVPLRRMQREAARGL